MTRKALQRDLSALSLLVICTVLVAIGALREWNRARDNEWKTRFLAGKPVTVRFICGTDSNFDCQSNYQVSYASRPNWCEHVSVNDGVDQTGWCNGNPSGGSFSITGAVFAYDRFGSVRLASKLVGQLFVPESDQLVAPVKL
jgi:hypothetical protein